MLVDEREEYGMFRTVRKKDQDKNDGVKLEGLIQGKGARQPADEELRRRS